MLLADDHAIVRRGLRGLLESAGVSVVAEAADGLEAIRLRFNHVVTRPRHVRRSTVFAPLQASLACSGAFQIRETRQ